MPARLMSRRIMYVFLVALLIIRVPLGQATILYFSMVILRLTTAAYWNSQVMVILLTLVLA